MAIIVSQWQVAYFLKTRFPKQF